MKNKDIKLLENDDWTVECTSPLEIRHDNGDFATGIAAEYVIQTLRNYNKKRGMSYKRFFKKLSKYYVDGIEGTNIYCKFYLEESTFSFELHQSNNYIRDFTRQPIYESVVYHFWRSKDNMKMIFKDILCATKEIIDNQKE